MKKILLAVIILSSTVLADYIPDKSDRGMRDLCRAIISNKADTYEADNDLYYLGLMNGAVDMAILAHKVNKDEVIDRRPYDIVHHVCQKTMQDKDTNRFGFRRMFNFKAYTSTRK